MGQALKKCGQKRNKEKRVLILGLDNSGKTTFLYRLKLGDFVETLPTVGFNAESIHFKKRFWRTDTINLFDVGGQDKIRHMWKNFYAGVNGIIFVLDSSDKDRIPEARDELTKVVQDPSLQHVPLLVLANKQDLNGSLNLPEIAEQLQLKQLKDTPWKLIATCAINGNGITDNGVQHWLKSSLQSSPKRTRKVK